MEVVFPEEIALPEDLDEGVEHLGPVERGVLVPPVGPGHGVGGEPAEVDQRGFRVGGVGQVAAVVLDQDQREPQLAEPLRVLDPPAEAVGDPERVVDPAGPGAHVGLDDHHAAQSQGAGGQREEPEAVPGADPDRRGEVLTRGVDRQVDRLQGRRLRPEPAHHGDEPGDQAVVDLLEPAGAGAARGPSARPGTRPSRAHRHPPRPSGPGTRRRPWAGGPGPRRTPGQGADRGDPAAAGRAAPARAAGRT